LETRENVISRSSRQESRAERLLMILAISGSLRRDSLNSAALRAAARVAARSGLEIAIDASPATLPHFSPDLEAEPPGAVLRFRRACESADAILLAVPEYAYGIPGTFKNALDWTVGSGSLYQKPIAILSIAPRGRGTRVTGALDAVFIALDADVAHHAVPVTPADRSANGDITDPRILEALHAVVTQLWAHTRSRSAETQTPLRSSS
jgi:chromate reductase, NAD(P)H dehydrogenase (quinone)